MGLLKSRHFATFPDEHVKRLNRYANNTFDPLQYFATEHAGHGRGQKLRANNTICLLSEAAGCYLPPARAGDRSGEITVLALQARSLAAPAR
jgi:hypothetical protein